MDILDVIDVSSSEITSDQFGCKEGNQMHHHRSRGAPRRSFRREGQCQRGANLERGGKEGDYSYK